MTHIAIISELQALGISLWVEDGQLRYRGPAGALTEDLRRRLRDGKAALISHLSAGALRADPDNRFKPFPLTDVQAAYLVGRGDAYDYGGVGCHGYVELEMADLDPARLQRAWHALIRRHDMLRAVVSRDGSQAVLSEVSLPSLAVADLRGRPAAEVEQAIGRVRDQMAARCYQPDHWPLYELRLTRRDGGAVLHLSIDLLIADFVSIQVMLAELDLLYRQPEAELPPIEVTFRDIVLARRAALDDGAEAARRQRDRAYWLERIASMPGAPDLPRAERRDVDAAPVFVRHACALAPAAWKDLCRQAQARKVTPSSAVMAAFAEVIGRWSRRPEFCLNVTVLSRPALHPHVDRVVGDFTSVNVLAVTPPAQGCFTTRAAALQERLWEDLEHQAFSGVEVLRELGRRGDRQGSIMPVVYTSTIGIGGDDGTGEFMSGARLSYGITQTPQVWLDCQVAERGGTLHVNWDVRQGVFPENLVEQAFAAFRTLLEHMAADAVWEARVPVSLPITTSRCREQVNRTAAPVPEGLLQDGFLAMARRRPEATALACGGVTLSYGELSARAGAVAKALAECGCRPGDRVAVVLDKGTDQIAAVLGVLMAGAVYLPVDTTQPVARRDVILGDAGVRHVLVQSSHLECDWPQEVRVLAVDRLAPVADWVAVAADPGQLAYIIYTSGTTGRPKGVMVSHRAALNTVADINARFRIGSSDRILGLANLGFDLSVYDIFGTFAAGGMLVLPDAGRRGDPSHWAALMAAHGVTVWNSVPAQMQMLTSYLASEGRTLPDLRLALLSGDWIPVALPDAVRVCCPGTRVVSLGGATEAAIWSIWYDIGAVEPGARSIPYGVPLCNQTFHVLDGRLESCPDWCPGELYIGGLGLADGYAGDPERTAERFIVHPRTGERLYRTGDMGRYRPDGIIEFLGREDTQVKIRGHRIELSEIETVVQSHPGVAAAAVLAGGSGLERRLAAFVEPVRAVSSDGEDAARSLAAAAVAAGYDATRTLDRAAFAEWVATADRIALLDILATLRRAGLFRQVGERHAWDEVTARTAAASRHHRLLRRWLSALCAEGWLLSDGDFHVLAAALPDDEHVRCWQRLQSLEAQVGYGAELLRYLRESAERLPELLRGEVDPLDLLFPQGRMDTAFAAYNDNLVNRAMNRAVCAAARTLAADIPAGRPFRVLEIGAGVGGTSSDLIPALADFQVEYLFTDVSPFFLNAARERYAAWPWVRHGLFDLNKPYWEQGLSAGSWDLIVCANVLHNARNAPEVMARLRELAVPGGALLMIEATREIRSLLTSMEFKEGLSGFTDMRQDGDQTFLTRAQWHEVFRSAGAETLCAFPDEEDRLSLAGQSVFALRFPADRTALRAEDIEEYLRGRLPDYMLPTRIEFLDALPLSGNGKVDRKALAARLEQGVQVESGGEEARDDLEKRIAALWAASLGRERLGRAEDFFVAGGDSLLIAQVVGRMREDFPEAEGLEWDRLMRDILRAPTVAAVAEALRRPAPAVQGTADASPLVRLMADTGETGVVRVLLHDGSGTLAPYRSLLSCLRRDGGRGGEIVGLSVVDERSYLDIAPDRLIEELAGRYAALLLRHGGRRFDLTGYCMGGLLALEVGRALLEAGAEIGPVTVISSDRFRYRVEDELLLERAFGGLLGADLAAAGHGVDDSTLAAALEHLRNRHGDHLPAGCLMTLDDEFAGVAACYSRLAMVPQPERLAALAGAVATRAETVGVEQVSSLYRVFRHSLDAVGRYHPAPFLGELTVLRDSETLHFLPGLASDIHGFWSDVALGDIRHQKIHGDHLTCLQPPHVEAVAAILLTEGQAA